MLKSLTRYADISSNITGWMRSFDCKCNVLLPASPSCNNCHCIHMHKLLLPYTWLSVHYIKVLL